MLNPGEQNLEHFKFLGRIMGLACRHGISLPLSLPSMAWLPLAGLPVRREHLLEIDQTFLNEVRRVEENRQLGDGAMVISLSDGKVVELLPNGSNIALNSPEKRDEYVRRAVSTRLFESAPQLRALYTGMRDVIPVDLLSLFSFGEVEALFCGEQKIDVNRIRENTEYEGGLAAEDKHITFLFEVLEELSKDELSKFLRFVSARSRLPRNASNPMRFRIQPASSVTDEAPDEYLPTASTCFFSLRLPKYSTKAVLREKLLYAIDSTPNMDLDVRLRSAEGWAP